MGEIVKSKLADNGKIILELHLDYDEALRLGGHMDGVHVFSESHMHYESRITRRGRKSRTTYLLIPHKLRQEAIDDSIQEKVACQIIKGRRRTFLVFMLEKGPHFPEKKKMQTKRKKRKKKATKG